MTQLWENPFIDVFLDAVSDGVILLNESGVVVCLSDRAAEVFRMPPGEVRGRALPELVDLRREPDGGGAIWTEPVNLKATCRQGGGLQTEVELHIHPVRVRQGPPRGYVALIEDLEEKRGAEEHVRRMDRLASLGQISAGIAHEIRNPLAGIQTSAEVLAERVGREQGRREFVDVILEEVRRLNRTVEGLVGLARPPSPKLAPCDIHRVIASVLALVSKQLENGGIRVLNRFEPGLARVEADADQMVQVVLNIVLNSIQAMDRGGTLEIVTGVRCSGGDVPEPCVGVDVIDTGCGIPGEALDRVFDPFYTTKPGGMGMGLCVCQRIVEAHGGRLTIESRPGESTRVSLDLRAVRSVKPGTVRRTTVGSRQQ